jgi:ABC-type transporter Mla maintaining outer membrane lipid asymmetry ATPase subunit MlaF
VTAAVSLRRLSLADRSGREVVAGLDLELAPGEAVVLSAPPEVGTAVLRAVVGLEAPSSGEARLLGEEVRALPRARAEALLARVGYLPRHGALVSNLPIRENLALPLRWHRHVAGQAALDEAARAGERFGLTELPAVIPPLVSVAVRRRVALARATVLGPEVLVLDDPTEDLDPSTSADVAGRLAEVARALGAAVLATSHEDDVPAALGARVLTLSPASTP